MKEVGVIILAAVIAMLTAVVSVLVAWGMGVLPALS